MFEDFAFQLWLVGPKFLIYKKHSQFSVCFMVLLEVIDELYAVGFTTHTHTCTHMHLGLMVQPLKLDFTAYFLFILPSL